MVELIIVGIVIWLAAVLLGAVMNASESDDMPEELMAAD